MTLGATLDDVRCDVLPLFGYDMGMPYPYPHKGVGGQGFRWHYTLPLPLREAHSAVRGIDLVLLSREDFRLGGCSRLRLLCSCCALDLPQWRAFGQGVLAHGVSVDAQLAGDRPEGESLELGLLHILPKSLLTSGGYFVLLSPGFARSQVSVHLASFQSRQVGVAPVSSAVDAAGQRGAFRRGGGSFPQQARTGRSLL